MLISVTLLFENVYIVSKQLGGKEALPLLLKGIMWSFCQLYTAAPNKQTKPLKKKTDDYKTQVKYLMLFYERKCIQQHDIHILNFCFIKNFSCSTVKNLNGSSLHFIITKRRQT